MADVAEIDRQIELYRVHKADERCAFVGLPAAAAYRRPVVDRSEASPTRQAARAARPGFEREVVMGSRSNDEQQVATAELDVETESRSTAAADRHKPVLRSRKHGSSAALLRRASDIKAIWFDRRLDPAFREELMVSVAAANSCRQCSYAHREWALIEGLPPEELAALERQDPESFDERAWAAVAWVHALAASDFTDVPEAIEANFRAQFSPQEQADIELVARTMTWMNQISNTVDAAVERVKGDPVSGSGVLTELEAVVLYSLAVPPLIVWLGVKEGRRPMQIVRSMSQFFREFDARVT
jgi:AhpD family alkylhydroperoxidase